VREDLGLAVGDGVEVEGADGSLSPVVGVDTGEWKTGTNSMPEGAS
jgi:hypothetical protein